MATKPPSIDPVAALRWQRHGHNASAWLHEEIASRMADRLQWIKLQPPVVAHWEPLLGGLAAHGLLRQRYPQARHFWLGANAGGLASAEKTLRTPWWKLSQWAVPRPHLQSPGDQKAQLVWANMALHGTANPLELIQSWHRLLAVDGFLMFSCLGPDTLRELRAVYANLGWPPPAQEFTDMHDWGDMLVASGFAEPVMDMERITLTFETPQRLLQELRGLGRNLHLQRFAGLRGRQWHQELQAELLKNLADTQADGRLKLNFEVIYGHALKPAKRLALGAETALSLEEMRQTLRAGKLQAGRS